MFILGFNQISMDSKDMEEMAFKSTVLVTIIK